MEHVPEFSYSAKDFQVQWFSGTGPGGQNRNKVQNCVSITHLPTGFMETGQSSRDRSANFRDAFQRLGKRVAAWVEAQIRHPPPPKSDETIRTYHHVENRVKDHASGHVWTWDDLEKRFGEMIMARLCALETR